MTGRVGLFSLISLLAQSFSAMKAPAGGPYISFLSQSAFFFRKALRSQERDGEISEISENDAQRRVLPEAAVTSRPSRRRAEI